MHHLKIDLDISTHLFQCFQENMFKNVNVKFKFKIKIIVQQRDCNLDKLH